MLQVSNSKRDVHRTVKLDGVICRPEDTTPDQYRLNTVTTLVLYRLNSVVPLQILRMLSPILRLFWANFRVDLAIFGEVLGFSNE